MHDHIDRTLHKCGVNGEEWAEPLGCVTTSKKGSVLLGYPNVKVALWNFFFEDFQFGASWHGRCDCGDGFVFFCKIGKSSAEKFGVSWVG